MAIKLILIDLGVVFMKGKLSRLKGLFAFLICCITVMLSSVTEANALSVNRSYPAISSIDSLISSSIRMNMSTLSIQGVSGSVGMVYHNTLGYCLYVKNVKKGANKNFNVTVSSTGINYGGTPSKWRLVISGTVYGAGKNERNQCFMRVSTIGEIELGGGFMPNKSVVSGVTLERTGQNRVHANITSYFGNQAWADGNVYNAKFGLIGTDLDTNSAADNSNPESTNSCNEEYILGGNFNGIVHTTNQCKLRISGSSLKAAYHATNTSDAASFNVAGFLAETSTGWCSCTINVHGSAGNFLYLKQLSNINTAPPTKSVDKTTANYNDTVTWSVKKTKGAWGSTQIVPYSSMVFKDTLPANMDYVSCQMYDNGSAVNYGTASYNASTRLLTYSISPTYLSNYSWYNGKLLELKIVTKCKVASHNTETRSNKATLTTDSSSVDTNTVSVSIPPTLRTITTEVVNGSIHPGYPDAYIGNDYTVDYTPNSDHYLKYIELDGTRLSSSGIENNMNEYTFENLQSDHHIKVVYAKNPVITLTKNITGANVVYAKGNPIFNFKISGTDYLNHDRVFYRQISFIKGDSDKKSIQIKIPAGDWTFSELGVNDWQFKKVEGSPTNKIEITNKKISIDTKDIDNGEIKYTNDVANYKDYTENKSIINRLK